VQHAPEAPSLTAINLHILKNLWLPDVEILDLKSFETHSVLSKLEGKGCMDGCDIWTFQFFLAILLKETVTRDRNRLNVSWLDRAYTLGNNQNCLVFFYFNHPFIRPCLDTWLPFEFGFKFVNIHAIFAGLPRALYHFIPHVCTLQ
jgi:hypothetical protein